MILSQKQNRLALVKDAESLKDIPENKLIRQFKIKNKNKTRIVNDPVPALKDILKDWNGVITDYYMKKLDLSGVSDIAHAYLPNKSIQTNVSAHVGSNVIQFDFKGFYDSCRFEYFEPALRDIDPSITDNNKHLIRRLLIDKDTGGVTQGLPVSGALAGIALIPFWVALKKNLPSSIRFTQYSDDLTFSHTGTTPDMFTVAELSTAIYTALKDTNRDFKLNADKTRSQKAQYRKVTGIRINHFNQTTPSQKDYRFLKHALYILSKSDDLGKELDIWGFKSKEAFIGKISYMRSIDNTGKIDRVIMKYAATCRRHNIFTTWIDANYKNSAFA